MLAIIFKAFIVLIKIIVVTILKGAVIPHKISYEQVKLTSESG